MPWFIVDDGFHSHMKAVRAGAQCLGLWVLAGSWSADQLTDGFVPDYIAARLDSSYEEHADSLVRAGLWIKDQVDGDNGWRFHQWSERQQSREDVLAKREAARERMRRLREQKKSGSRDVRANTSRSSQQVREPDTDTDTDSKNLGSSTKSTNNSSKLTRKQDPLWDALMAACGVETATITKSSRGAYNAAVKDLRSVEATPSQVTLRARRFAQKWPGISITPTALVRRWAELGTGAYSDPVKEERCPTHQRQPADTCGICASERNGAPRGL